MRVIDLLNKIANGEEVPKQIKYEGKIYTYDENFQDYKMFDNYGSNWLINKIFDESEDTLHALSYELEIIEEDKEIEHYDMFDNFTGFGFGGTDKELLSDLQNNFEHINEELDYLIKAVNELKKGK